MNLPYKFKTTPFKHQLTVWDRSKNLKNFALLMDMGTGKTKVSLDTAAFMFDQGWINAMIVFGNKGSYLNWIEGIEEHLPSHIPYKLGWWNSANKSKDWDRLYSLFDPTSDPLLKIMLMNIEALPFKKSLDCAKKFTRSHRTMAVVDESTTISNPKAKRTKAAWKIGELAVARRILTGSVIDNNPLMAWAQYEFLSHGILGYTSFHSFRSQFAELQEMTTKTSPRPFKVVIGYKNLNRLKDTINKCSFIVKKEDCLDLPSKIYETFYIDLTPEQASLYKQMQKESLAILEKENEGENQLNVLSAKMAITRNMRLHQIASGHMPDDDGGLHPIKNNRISALESIIEEISGRVIVWANYKHDLRKITDTLRSKYGEDSTFTYYGETDDEERARVKEIFKRGREIEGARFIVGNVQTGGFGLNLTAVTTSIYYSNSFDNNLRHQSEDRLHRIGQTEKVTYIDITARGTVDEKVVKALQQKKKVVDMVVQSNWKESFL